MGEQVMYIAAIKLPPGKLAAQVGHAVLGLYRLYPQAKPLGMHQWLTGEGVKDGGYQAKVVLKLENREQFDEIVKFCGENTIMWYAVHDAGRTVVEPGTMTAIAWGPVPKDMDGPWKQMRLY